MRISKDSSRDKTAIEITDQGGGISQQYRDQIFDPFVSTKETGMGLGLAISRRIVRSHGGEITAIASHNGGATFRVQLPLREVSQGVTSA